MIEIHGPKIWRKNATIFCKAAFDFPGSCDLKIVLTWKKHDNFGYFDYLSQTEASIKNKTLWCKLGETPILLGINKLSPVSIMYLHFSNIHSQQETVQALHHTAKHTEKMMKPMYLWTLPMNLQAFAAEVA